LPDTPLVVYVSSVLSNDETTLSLSLSISLRCLNLSL
jgi:hypothetical protein